MAADRVKPLLHRKFFIYVYTRQDVEDDVIAMMTVKGIMDCGGYDRFYTGIARLITELSGSIEPSDSADVPVVVKHLPTWEFTKYKRLVHASYLYALENATEDASIPIPHILDYTFRYVSKAKYIDIRDVEATCKWFAVL